MSPRCSSSVSGQYSAGSARSSSPDSIAAAISSRVSVAKRRPPGWWLMWSFTTTSTRHDQASAASSPESSSRATLSRCTSQVPSPLVLHLKTSVLDPVTVPITSMSFASAPDSSTRLSSALGSTSSSSIFPFR